MNLKLPLKTISVKQKKTNVLGKLWDFGYFPYCALFEAHRMPAILPAVFEENNIHGGGKYQSKIFNTILELSPEKYEA